MTALGHKVTIAVLGVLLVTAGTVAAEPAKIDKKADELLKAMSDKLSAAKQLRISLKRTTDSGLIEGSEKPETVAGHVLVQRPNKLAAEITTKGHRRRLVYDGTRVSLLDLEANRYATVSAPANIDDTLKMLDEDYGYAPPLADFLLSDPYGHFMRQIKEGAKEFKSGKYAGLVTIAGSQFHYLAFREKYVHWDLWIDSKTILPRRFVVTATGIEGNPKLAMEFLGFDLAPKVDPTAFAFKAPAGARQIPMPKAGKSAETRNLFESAGKKQTAKDFKPAPATVKTSFGTLTFEGGAFPTDASVQKIYDEMDLQRANQTRAMLQTDQQFPGRAGMDKGVVQNADGSFDMYFGPKAPAGKEGNWIQTVPGKGWNMLFRLYGPLKPWFDKTWRPSDPQVVE